MSEFLGSRISLISKSDIRYVGTLHEINSDESTVSLENVRSFGTEGRKGRPEEEIAPSEQVYEYIVFRGSDVKDLRIEEHPTIKENKPPPSMPDDPAIVGARPRPAGQASTNQPPGPPGFGQNHFQNQNQFYPPPGPWGRAGGPGPGPGGPGGPGMGGMQYPPPPGWFPPGLPGQGFPPGPGPWNNFAYPPGPQGQMGAGGPPSQSPGPRGTPGAQDSKQALAGAGNEKQKTASGQNLSPAEPKSLGQPALQSAMAPTPPVESKPSVEEVKATAASLNATGSLDAAGKAVPTGPKNSRVAPALPLSSGFSGKATQPSFTASGPTPNKSSAAATAASLRDATQAAKAAVAVAMAKLDASNNAAIPAHAPSANNGSAMDNLTKRVNEMRVNANRNGPAAGRGRGRGGRPQQAKIEVPDSDFDFSAANAKFNREDLVKEAIAGGSPVTESAANGTGNQAKDELLAADPPVAYNKTRSFFDNISSEAKERAENQGQKPGGREWRGEEQRKNMETFGQGSVDGGYRNFRGRGRGRGNPRGRGFGGQRGGRGGYRGRDGQASGSAAEN